MYGDHTNAYGSKLDLAVKNQMSMYVHHFSNFGRPPVPDDLCKDSAPRYLSNIGPEVSEEKLFEILNIFPIQTHREAKLIHVVKTSVD